MSQKQRLKSRDCAVLAWADRRVSVTLTGNAKLDSPHNGFSIQMN